MKSRILSFSLPPLAAAVFLFFGGRASAATITWDGGGGDLLWNTGNNWDTNVIPATTDTIVFASSFTSGTAINLNGNRTINDLSITSTTDFSLNGNTLTITTGNITRSAATGTTTINSAVSLGANATWNITGNLISNGIISAGGASTLTKSGAGTLTFNAANTYTGATVIDGGTLTLSGANGAIASSTGITINGGTLQLDNDNTSNNGDRIGSVTVTMNGGTFDFAHASNNVDYLETAGTLSINSGASTISTDVTSNPGSSILTFGALSRTVGATVNFGGGSGNPSAGIDNNNVRFTAAPTLVNGIIGGYATVGGTDWAIYTGGGTASVGALGTYETSTTIGNWAATENISIGANPSANLDTRTLNSLKFTGNSTVTINSGQTLTITSGGLLATGSGIDTITGGTLQGAAGADLVVHQNSSGTFTINSVIADNGSATGLTKSGTGTLSLSGTTANTYTGATTVNDGRVDLNKTAVVNAFAGSLAIGDSTGAANSAEVRITTANQQMATTTAVSLLSDGLFALNGNNQTIGTLSMTAGSVTTDAGTLTLGGNVTGILFASSATISGNLNLGTAVRTFAIADGGAADDMSISAVISNGGVTKTGAGRLTLSGANTYTGTTTITGGSLLMGVSNALTSSTGITLNGGALETGGLTGSTGELSLLSSSVIDMGSGTSHLTFSSPSSAAWNGVLSVWKWNGSTAGGGTDQILFTNIGNLDATELSNIQFYSGEGSGGNYPMGAIVVGNELVPVPEPGAVMAAVLLLGVAGWRERRTWLHYRPVAR